MKLVRYCDLCGRRVRIELDKLNELRREGHKITCAICTWRHRTGVYTDDVIHSD